MRASPADYYIPRYDLAKLGQAMSNGLFFGIFQYGFCLEWRRNTMLSYR